MGPEIFRQLRLEAHRLRRVHALALALAGCGLAAAPAQAQDSESADTTATILTPGSIVKTVDMDFGQVAVGATGGTVTMSAASSATCTASAGLMHSGTCRAAAFDVYGLRNWKIRLRETTGTITLTGSAGGTLTLTNLTIGVVGMSSAPGGGAGWNLGRYNIDTANGIANFYIGGRLNVAAGQTPGIYNGTFVVEALFN